MRKCIINDKNLFEHGQNLNTNDREILGYIKLRSHISFQSLEQYYNVIYYNIYFPIFPSKTFSIRLVD